MDNPLKRSMGRGKAFLATLQNESSPPLVSSRIMARFSKNIGDIGNFPFILSKDNANRAFEKQPSDSSSSSIALDELKEQPQSQEVHGVDIAATSKELKSTTIDDSKNSKFHRENVPPEIMEQIRSLPIRKKRNELIDLIKNNQIVIVVGETGSGKSTQIPQYIVEAGMIKEDRMIGITQPRRIAAKSLAERVALECGVELGNLVGYSVRFDSCISPTTIIKYMTDGLLGY